MALLKELLVTIILLLSCVDSARILGMYPTPSISHQVVFRVLTLELVKRGHDVVVITPDPVFKNQTGPKNLREIDISESYAKMMEKMMSEDLSKFIKRGVIFDMIGIMEVEDNLMLEMKYETFLYPQVKDLIADKTQKFDLVIVEALSHSSLMFSKIYDAPAILFSSFFGTAENYLAVGGVSRHPIFYPNFYRRKFRNMNIFDKIQEVMIEWKAYKWDQLYERKENEFLKSQFGEDAPTLAELNKYIELLFVNAHPVFEGNRPVPPGVIYLGAMHLKAIKELPQDLKAYLDSSSRGVIYVSLGTNVRPSMMDKDLLDEFLKAFDALPYDILWKFDGDSLPNIPKNVKIQKWFPQRDLLGHPNIKLFIMQGGLQSTDEAIDAGVPLVGIPFLGDQWYNVNKYVELGIGVEVDALTLKAEQLVAAANKVIADDSFRKNIARLRSQMHDQPDTPLDRAVWWTEYVLRHGRSRSLLASSVDSSWSEYLLLDVLLALVMGATACVSVIAVTLNYAIRLLFKNDTFKIKKS